MKTKTTQNYLGNRALKIETLIPCTNYALSINPMIQPTSFTRDKILVWYKRMHDWLYDYRQWFTIVLWPEVSPTGRFHFHGTIRIDHDTPTTWILYTKLVNDLGGASHFEIDTISEDTASAYDDYCTKQSSKWKAIFSSDFHTYPLRFNNPRALDLTSKSTVGAQAGKSKIEEYLEVVSASSDTDSPTEERNFTILPVPSSDPSSSPFLETFLKKHRPAPSLGRLSKNRQK